MSSSVRDRIKLRWLLGLLAFLVVATYAEFVYLGSPTVYDFAMWAILAPWLLSYAVRGIDDHPLYQPLHFGALVAIGVLQYLDGEWQLLAAVFVFAGVFGLAGELRDRRGTTT